ncbi:MAG: efflux RND transporter periplasmic adaptor subunit [Bacteroidota bacterium]|nr:efflux RND transporter periplasmic adaptor subunit [Bacteroidota bacterium]
MQAKEKSVVAVDLVIARNQNFPNSIEVNGTVLSEEMVELHPEVSGRLTYLNIPDGAKVKEGTILAKINDADLQAQLEQLKAQLDLALKTEQRLKKLLLVNGINQADYDAASNQVITIQASIKLINAQIDKTVIRAPFSGELGLRLVSNGSFVTPQTLIGTLQVMDKVKIDFTVPETYANLVNIGNTVYVETTESDVKELAKIIAVEPQISTVTRNLKVRARLNSGVITPGAFVKVMFNDEGKGIVIPSNAVIPDAYSNQVIIVKNGKAKFQNVETGIRTADVIEILKGISPGDSVVVSGVLFVRPNAKLKIKKVKK